MPALWLVQLPLSFWLVWNACAVQRTAHLVWIMGATAILAAITALASWRQRWRGVPAVDPEDAVADRIRFVAWIGMLLSVQILIVLVAQALALLILKPCD